MYIQTFCVVKGVSEQEDSDMALCALLDGVYIMRLLKATGACNPFFVHS